MRVMRTKRLELTTRGISLPATMDRQLVAQAERERRPVSWVIRAALDAYLSEVNDERDEE